MSLLTNLVSYWKLDESSGNAADTVGSNTLTNTNVTYAAAKINNGGDFNGTSALFSAGTTATLKTSAFTISAWIKGDSFATNYRIIASNQIFGNFYGYNIGVTTGGKLSMAVQSASVNRTATGGTTLSTGTFYHIVGRYDGANLTVFVNGTSDGVENTGVTVAYESSNFKLGNRDSSTTNWFDGIIDEVGFWSRALTQDEITELYDSGAGVSYPFYDLEVAPPALSIVDTFYAPSLTFTNPLAVSAPLLSVTNTFYAPSLQIGIWSNLTKNTATWTAQSKNAATWTNQDKSNG